MDDEGRCEDDPEVLSRKVFMLRDSVGTKDVDEALAELAEVGLVVRYEANGNRCLAMPGFRDWQKPTRPSVSNLPSPDEADSTHGAFSESSVRLIEPSVSHIEPSRRSGVEWSGGGDGDPRARARGGDDLPGLDCLDAEGCSDGTADQPQQTAIHGTPPQSAQSGHAAPETPAGEETIGQEPASPTEGNSAPTEGADEDTRRFAERWRDHATNELGLALPDATRLSSRFRAVFNIILTHTHDPHSATIAFVTDYIEIACGDQHKLNNGERAFLARVAREWPPTDVFDAAVTAVTSGAGTGEYADHPKPVVAFMRQVLGKK